MTYANNDHNNIKYVLILLNYQQTEQQWAEIVCWINIYLVKVKETLKYSIYYK